jgi:hypothetical protein
LNENLKLLKDVLLNEETNIVQNHCELLFELINKAVKLDPLGFKESLNKPLESLNDKLPDILVRIIDFIVGFFPRIPGRFVPKITSLLKVY